MLYSVSPARTTCMTGVGVGWGVGVNVWVGVAVGVCVGGSVAVARGVRVGIEVGVKVYVGALTTRVDVVSTPGLACAAPKGCMAWYARLPTIAVATINRMASPQITARNRDLRLGEGWGTTGSDAAMSCASGSSCGSRCAAPRAACSKAARLRSV